MSDEWMLFSEWWLRTAIGGGLVLTLAWLWMRHDRQPARQQRIAEAGVATALLLAGLCCLPGWVNLPLLQSASKAVPEIPAHEEEVALAPPAVPPSSHVLAGGTERETAAWVRAVHNGPAFLMEPENEPAAAPQAQDQSTDALTLVSLSQQSWFTWPALAASLYALLVVLFLGRCVLGQWAIWRLKRGAIQPPRYASRLFRRLARGRVGRARLLISRQVRVPISCGLLRPTVIIPATFCAPESRVHLDWVFAHELTHLERRDNWACLLYAIGQAIYFYVPCFWWLRRQARLCQEYIADAAAVERAAAPEEYAQLLLRLTKSPRAPVGATAVSGNPSDLYRRVTMLLRPNNQLQRTCSLGWLLKAGVGFTSLALLLAGIGLRVQAGTQDPQQTEQPNKSARKAPPKPADDAARPATAAQAKPTPRRPLQGDPFAPDQSQVPPELREQLKRLNEEMKKFQEQFDNLGIQGLQGFQGFPFDPNTQPNFRPFQGLGGLQSGGGRLGLSLKRPDPALADQLELHKGNGLVVEKVDAGSAADKAGFKPHDVLIEVKGQMVPSDVRELQKVIAEIKTGTPFDAVVLRKGQRQTVKGITLPEKGAEQPAQRFFGGGEGGLRGFEFQPNFQQPGQGNLFGQAFGQGLGGAGRSVMTSTMRNNDRFTTRHQEGSLVITVTGKVDGGQSEVSQIQIQDGAAASKTYKTVSEVPEQYRDKVKNLVEMSEKSNIKIEIKDGPK